MIKVPSLQKGAAQEISKMAVPTEHYVCNCKSPNPSSSTGHHKIMRKAKTSLFCKKVLPFDLFKQNNLMSMRTLEIMIVFLSPEQFSSMELGHFVIQ